MTDQTPAEMRGRAHSLRLAIRPGMYEGQIVDPEVIAFQGNVRAGAGALDRLADVIEWALDVENQVIDYEAYAMAQEDSLTIARGETNEEVRNHE